MRLKIVMTSVLCLLGYFLHLVVGQNYTLSWDCYIFKTAEICGSGSFDRIGSFGLYTTGDLFCHYFDHQLSINGARIQSYQLAYEDNYYTRYVLQFFNTSYCSEEPRGSLMFDTSCSCMFSGLPCKNYNESMFPHRVGCLSKPWPYSQ